MAQEDESDDGSDRSRSFQFITWILFVVSVFVVATRLATKFARTRKLGWDDWTIVLAIVATLAECIAVAAAASRGPGRTSDSLTDDRIDSVLMAIYASTPLFILACTVVKLSVLISIKQLSPDAKHQHVNTALGVLTGLWFIASTVLSLFLCSVPEPWNIRDRSECVNLPAAWTFIAILNIITDLSIVLLFDIIIWNLHTAFAKKATLLVVFSARLLVVAIAIIQLITVWAALSNSDTTYSLWLPTALNQGLLCLSFIAACVAYLRPFMESLHSDILRVDDIAGSDEDVYPRTNNATYGSYSMSRARAWASTGSSR
jgi:hypothetical protein